MAEAHWYVVHTYSGYENKVKIDIKKTIENRGLQDQILEVSVPMLPVVEVKNGVEKQADKKMFPGYVLIKMVMNDDTWYVVRNTRGVTGFVGPGSKPVPLTEEEIAGLGFQNQEDADSGLQNQEVAVDFEIGDLIVVTSGAWKDTVGAIKAINKAKKSITISVEMFGRETPVELNFTEVKKM
ncbi:transcription termination/antitermination protein NusG [Lachnospiraceae bacterium 62-35]